MHRLKSGMVWFEDEEWIGHKVSFDHQPCPSTWRLVQKIREREKYEPEHSWKSMEIPSEARGIFICEEEGQQYRQGVVKIYMQYDPPVWSWRFWLINSRIPFYGTISEPQHIRSKQARTETDYLAQHEILALQSLTDAGCTSTPSLIAWKNTAQDDERYVPGGYLTYILMEKASGINLEDFDRLPREERDQVRVAFKSSWT